MRLFVRDRINQKVYLDISARDRQELYRRIGFSFFVGDQSYTVNQVSAEKSSNDTAGGALIGGLIGLLGGGGGVLLGGLLGGVLGKNNDDKEQKLVDYFNNSIVTNEGY